MNRDITSLQRQCLQVYLVIITFKRALSLAIHTFSCEQLSEMSGDGSNSYTTEDRRKHLLPVITLTASQLNVFCTFSLWKIFTFSTSLYTDAHCSIHSVFCLLSLTATSAHLLSQDPTPLTLLFTFQKSQLVHVLEYVHVPGLFLHHLANISWRKYLQYHRYINFWPGTHVGSSVQEASWGQVNPAALGAGDSGCWWEDTWQALLSTLPSSPLSPLPVPPASPCSDLWASSYINVPSSLRVTTSKLPKLSALWLPLEGGLGRPEHLSWQQTDCWGPQRHSRRQNPYGAVSACYHLIPPSPPTQVLLLPLWAVREVCEMRHCCLSSNALSFACRPAPQRTTSKWTAWFPTRTVPPTDRASSMQSCTTVSSESKA